MTISVVLPLPVDQAYTYEVPAALVGEVRVGSRVVVPFGRRVLTGIVVGEGDAAEGRRLKPIQDVLDEEPAFTPEMLRLTRWMADYYLCSWGEAVRAALPAGIEVESKRLLHRADADPSGPLATEVARILEDAGALSVEHLSTRASASVTLSFVRRLAEQGVVRIQTELVPPKVSVKTERTLHLAPALRDEHAFADALDVLRGDRQKSLLRTVAQAGDTLSQPAALKRAGATSSTANSLVKKGFLEAGERELIRTPLGELPAVTGPPPARTLHPAQAEALQTIKAAISAERYEAFLLHGVTGSGKTEVYIAALKQTLDAGKSGIVLVPEIALTPQTVLRFRRHFGDEVAVLHSRMSAGERYDAWRQIRAGTRRVVIGPRSAVLAPVERVGLIVVDEEHESSYKQFDPAPRYHARDVAVWRAHANSAVCILGSATPSIESHLNASGGKYTLLRMPKRVPVPGRKAAPMPAVEVVDLTKEKKRHRLTGHFSERLHEAIERRLERGEQVILLQNRRGYAPVIECQSCGWSPTCRDCEVTMTYHKPRQHVRCHYCGYAHRRPQQCPKCDSDELTMHGLGTQRVEEELRERFPSARVLRMDLDTTSRKDAHRKILDQFGRGEADILVGTQMIAKGLDFGRVTLVGVLNADTGLLMPDFRASERTFQLLTQVAGRAGRAELTGEVILQTRTPKHNVLRYAQQHDYLGFVESELPDRHATQFPPFARLVTLTVRGPNRSDVEAFAERLVEALRSRLDPRVEVYDPVPAFIARVKRQYRVHATVKVPRTLPYALVKAGISEAVAAAGRPPRETRLAVDVDPVGVF